MRSEQPIGNCAQAAVVGSPGHPKPEGGYRVARGRYPTAATRPSRDPCRLFPITPTSMRRSDFG